MDTLKNIISNNEYLKKQISKLENWETDYFHTNEINGVDAFVYLDYRDFGYISKHSNFVEALEEVIDELECGIFFKKDDPSISISSSDDNFITFNGKELICGDTSYAIQDDFDTWLYFEKNCIETGVYGGLYKVGYYGDCDPYSFDEDYGKYFSDDEKKRLAEIEKILEVWELHKQLDQTTLMHWDLPSWAWDLLPKAMQSLDDGIEILRVEELSPTSCEVIFEFFEDDWIDEVVNPSAIVQGLEQLEGNEYKFTLNFKTNAVRFLRELNQGDGDEMSFMSVG